LKWGSDEGIIEAARMSTDKGFEGWGGFYYQECTVCDWKSETQEEPHICVPTICPQCASRADWKRTPSGDERLLKYLYEHWHHTPFEMAGFQIEIKAPIMVIREWERHRTQSYNEMSGRYVPLPNENYVPSVDRILMQSAGNKQAGAIKGADQITMQQAHMFRQGLIDQYEQDQLFYDLALKMGVPKELARLHVPVGRYSRMRAQAVLRNWLAFATLRDDSHAQWEIQQYAKVVVQLIAEHFPRTHALYLAQRQDREDFLAWKKARKN
jgi:thymidylate synthase (FAD)